MNIEDKDVLGQEKSSNEKTYSNHKWRRLILTAFVVSTVIVIGVKIFGDNRQAFYYPDGKTIQNRGDYNEDGQGIGKHTSYRKDGTKSNEQYYDKKGKLHSTYTTWFENGEVRWTQEYLHGKKDGDYFNYDCTGTVLVHEIYQSDSLIKKIK